MRKIFICLLNAAFCLLATPSNGQSQGIRFTYDEAKKELTMKSTERCAFLMDKECNKPLRDNFAKVLADRYNGQSYSKEALGHGYEGLAKWFFFDGCDATIPYDTFSAEDSAILAASEIRIAKWGDETVPLGVGVDVEVEVTIDHCPNNVHEPDDASSKQEEPLLNMGNAASGIPWLAVIGASLLLLCFVVGFVLYKHKGKRHTRKHKPLSSAEQEDLGLVVVVEEEKTYDAGLDWVRKDEGHYYVMDLGQVFLDTAVRKLYFHHSAIKKMYDYFKRFLESPEQTNETGCYFVGCWEYADVAKTEYNISVEDIVEPGDDIVPGEFSFSFGKKIGIKVDAMIDSLREQTHRDYVHTIWMHSHPGLGLFLSSHDLVVQQMLAYQEHKNRLVAIVIDTNTPNWEMAVFAAKHDGGMNNKDTLAKTFSLEELYLWSRDAQKMPLAVAEDSEPPRTALSIDVENYHVVQINHQCSDGIENLYFNGTSINAMDDIIYHCDGTKGICGYFIGHEEVGNSFVIDNCIKDNSEQMIGIFIDNNTETYQNIVNQYVHAIPTNGFAMIYRSDEELWICVKRGNDTNCDDEKNKTCCSLTPMKEWTRRRRIYK